jgi:class 3 adenylate cyclase
VADAQCFNGHARQATDYSSSLAVWWTRCAAPARWLKNIARPVRVYRIVARQDTNIEMQLQPPDRRIEYRIGIHQGDIVVEDGDIFGDGVNVAARLEGLADPAGICVSARVQEAAAGKLDLAFEDIGEQQPFAFRSAISRCVLTSRP